MNITLTRFSNGAEDTLGLMSIDGKFECFTLEDQYRSFKVRGDTRIPEGTYKIKFREVNSPMTEKYQKRFRWFKWHLELQDVPNFQYVYIHIGNNEKDTDGCILVGDEASTNVSGYGYIKRSTQAYERLYSKIKQSLISGKEVTITIKDL